VTIPVAQLKQLEDAISVLSSPSAIQKEKEELKELKSESHLMSLGHEALDTSLAQPKEPKDVHKLREKVNEMIDELEEEANKIEKEVGDKLHLIHTREDGRMSLRDLEQAFERIKGHPDSDAIKIIVKQLDVDGDGFVSAQEVYRLVQDLEDTEGIHVQKDKGTISFLTKSKKKVLP
jgi:hypothetical protein